MCRTILLSVIFISCFGIFNGYSQTFYLKPHFGYGFEANKNYYYTVSSTYTLYPDSTIYSDAFNSYFLSFGKGSIYGLTFGYSINSNISIEIDAAYVKGKSQEIRIEDFYQLYNNAAYKIDAIENIEVTGTMYNFTPLVLISYSFNKLVPYIKTGPVFSICSLKEISEFRTYNSIPGFIPFENTDSEFEYKRRLSVGIATALGVEYKTKGNVLIFGELMYSNINYIPKSGEYKVYDYEGKDQLDKMTVSQKEYEYVESYDENDNNDTSQPTKQLIISFAFSNLAINFGLRIDLPGIFKRKIHEQEQSQLTSSSSAQL